MEYFFDRSEDPSTSNRPCTKPLIVKIGPRKRSVGRPCISPPDAKVPKLVDYDSTSTGSEEESVSDKAPEGATKN